MGIIDRWKDRRDKKKEDKDKKTETVTTKILPPKTVDNNNNNNNNGGGGRGGKEDLYINIDDVNTNPNNGYDYDAGNAEVYTRTGGGGGSKSTFIPTSAANLRGGSSNTNTNTNQNNIVDKKNPTKADLLKDTNPNKKNEIKILRSGGVRWQNESGKWIESVGNAIVGDTGKTANQLQKELRDKYKEETGEVVGQGRLSGTLTTEVFVQDTKGEDVYFDSSSPNLTASEMFLGGSSNSNKNSKDTYNLATQTYTDEFGNKQSMRYEDAKKENIKIIYDTNEGSFLGTAKDFKELDKKTRPNYSPEIGGFISASESGSEGTAYISPLGLNELTPNEVSEIKRNTLNVEARNIFGNYVDKKKDQAQSIINLGKETYNVIAPPVKTGANILGGFVLSEVQKNAEKTKRNIQIADSIISPVSTKLNENLNVFFEDVKRGYNKVSPIIEDYTQSRINKRLERTQRTMNILGDVGRKVVPPLVLFGGAVGKEYIENLKDQGERYKQVYDIVAPPVKKTGSFVFDLYLTDQEKKAQRRQEKIEAGKEVINVISPYVKTGATILGGFALEESKRKAEKRQQNLRIADSIISPVSTKLNENLNVFFEDVKKPIKKVGGFLFAPVLLTGSQTENQAQMLSDIKNEETFTIVGNEVKVNPEKGYIGNIYSGTLEATKQGYTSLGIDTGLSREMFKFNQQDPREDWLKYEAAGSIWNPREPTKEEIKKEAEEFGGRVSGLVDFGTYFTPIAPARIIGEAAEAQFLPDTWKSDTAPKNFLEYASRNPEDVLFIGTLGLFKAAGAGAKVLTKPIYKTEIIGGETLFKRPLTTIARGNRFNFGSLTRDVKPVYSVSDEFVKGYRITETNRLRNLFGKAPKEVKVVKPKYLTREFKGELITEVTEGETKVFLRGFEEEKLVKKVFDGVTSKGGEGSYRLITSELQPVEGDLFKFVTKVKESRLSNQGVPYSKLSDFKVGGKSELKLFEGLTKSKEKGEVLELGYARGGQLSKKFLTGKKIEGGVSDILYSKEKPLLEVTYDVIGDEVGFKGAGKKSSPQFFESLYQEQKQIPVSEIIRKEVPKKSPSPKLEIETPTKSESIWAGTGMYERTEEVSYSQVQPTILSVSPQNVKVQTPSVSTKEIQVLKDITKSRSGSKGRTQQKERNLFKETQDFFQETKQKQSTQQKTKQSQKQELLSKLAEQFKQTQRTTQTTTFEIPKIKTPKIPIPTFPKEPTSKVKEVMGDFAYFAREKGKDIKVGKAKTEEEALFQLKSLLGEKLRASGFITKGGQKIKISDFGEGFTRSKVDPFRIVEKKSRRIKRKSKSSESKDIQKFRKKRGKKSGWF